MHLGLGTAAYSPLDSGLVSPPAMAQPAQVDDTRDALRSFEATSRQSWGSSTLGSLSTDEELKRLARRRAQTPEDKEAMLYARAAVALRELRKQRSLRTTSSDLDSPVPEVPTAPVASVSSNMDEQTPAAEPQAVVPLLRTIPPFPTLEDPTQRGHQPSLLQYMMKLQAPWWRLHASLQPVLKAWRTSWSAWCLMWLCCAMAWLPRIFDVAILLTCIVTVAVIIRYPELVVRLFSRLLRAVPWYAEYAAGRMANQLLHELDLAPLTTATTTLQAEQPSLSAQPLNITVVPASAPDSSQQQLIMVGATFLGTLSAVALSLRGYHAAR